MTGSGDVIGINTALFVVGQVIAHGRVRSAHLGIAAQTLPLPRRLALALNLGPRAVRIGEMEAGGPADRGGLKVGDILIGIDDKPVAGADDLIRTLGAEAIGRALEAKVIRGGTIERRRIVPDQRR